MSEWMSDWREEKREETGREGGDRRKKGREEPSFLFWASCDLVSWRKWEPGRMSLGKSCACYMHCTWQGGAGSGSCQVIAIAWCVLHFTSAFSSSVSPSVALEWHQLPTWIDQGQGQMLICLLTVLYDLDRQKGSMQGPAEGCVSKGFWARVSWPLLGHGSPVRMEDGG